MILCFQFFLVFCVFKACARKDWKKQEMKKMPRLYLTLHRKVPTLGVIAWLRSSLGWKRREGERDKGKQRNSGEKGVKIPDRLFSSSTGTVGEKRERKQNQTKQNKLQGPSSRLQAPGSRLQSPGSSLQSPGSRLQAPGSSLRQAPLTYPVSPVKKRAKGMKQQNSKTTTR